MPITLREEPSFYASVVDAGRLGLLAGPFTTHEEALAMVEPARRLACELNDWAWFYGFGTVRMKNGHRPGVLNERLGLK